MLMLVWEVGCFGVALLHMNKRAFSHYFLIVVPLPKRGVKLELFIPSFSICSYPLLTL